MRIGLSTYAFFWQHSERVARPLPLEAMLDRAAEKNVEVLQICDYPAVGDLPADRLAALRDRAAAAGIGLELGTRGVRADHLRRYLALAETLEAPLLRSMAFDSGPSLTADEMARDLAAVLPQFDAAGVTLALETYEQIATNDLVDLVARVDHPRLGICLDPANCVAALEQPDDVIDRCADRCVNVHVKDFAFTRRDGLVGFTLSGAPLGDGLLDLPHLLDRVRPVERGLSLVIEHWLPWQDDEETTIATENAWTDHNIEVLRSIQ